MNVAQFSEQEVTVRRGVHFHNGVWWKRTAWGCSQPVYPLHKFSPLASKPKRIRAPLRFSHAVPDGTATDFRWICLMMPADKLATFSFENLKREKRRAVNKAKKSGISVQKIEDMREYWSDLQRICISTAKRTRHGLPPEYYVEEEARWKATLTKEFLLSGREWFGAFKNGALVAYQYSCVVSGTANLLATKFDDDYRTARPSDALQYFVLCYYRDRQDCDEVYAGRSVPTVPTIDSFKQAFGFERTEMPVFVWTNPVAACALRLFGPAIGLAVNMVRGRSRRGVLYNAAVIASNRSGPNSRNESGDTELDGL